jgi:hypothetical protein
VKGDKMNQRKGRRRSGYQHKSPAVCIVVYDLGGNPMPDNVAAQILNVVTDEALRHGYVISFTRT